MTDQKLTENQIQLISMTFAKIIPIAPTVVEAFYEHLFEQSEEIKALFVQTDMKKQTQKMIQTLAFVVNGFSFQSRLIPAVRQLGERHTGYGVRLEHYEIVKQSLLVTLKNQLGDECTPKVAEAWSAGLDFIIEIATEAYTTRQKQPQPEPK